MSRFFRDFVDGFKPMEGPPPPTDTPAGLEYDAAVKPGSYEDDKALEKGGDLEVAGITLEQNNAPAAPENLRRHLTQRHMQMIAFGGRCVFLFSLPLSVPAGRGPSHCAASLSSFSLSFFFLRDSRTDADMLL